jgi:hypothetical protein
MGVLPKGSDGRARTPLRAGSTRTQRKPGDSPRLLRRAAECAPYLGQLPLRILHYSFCLLPSRRTGPEVISHRYTILSYYADD